MKFRNLRADEVEVRVQQAKEKGCILLLYKDARCDQSMLDETVGSMNWRRTHEVVDGQLFCNVDIWDSHKKEWVRKQDVGTESMTEKEKGRASDSFKRACFNWGIGRELYSSPFIWVNLSADEVDVRGGKFYLKSKVKFEVSKFTCENNKITELEIKDQAGKVRYSMRGEVVRQPVATNKQVQSNFVPTEEDIENLKKVKSKAEFTEFVKQFDRWKEDVAFRSWVKTKWEKL